jgi:hypothetical protein
MSFPNDAVEAKPLGTDDFPDGSLKLTHGKLVGALGAHRGSVEAELMKTPFPTFNTPPYFRSVTVESRPGNSLTDKNHRRNYRKIGPTYFTERPAPDFSFR